MAEGSPAIEIVKLGKRYPLRRKPKSQSIREAMTDSLRAIVRGAAEPTTDDFWAVRDVTLTVNKGENIGIVGPNGSGKSTLLKMLSRIVKPSEGHAIVRGRVGALLEVGTGFHPELTGRDNIFLNGAIIGMRGMEIRRRFDEIVDFAGVSEFLDTPIKRYSSGMVMRLAFAVAAHLEPDVLIVDEVLAVGDAEFQRKSLNKINDVSTNGCTVFFVSHNLSFVQQLCNRALMLQHGQLIADGPPAQVVSSYLERNAVQASPDWWQPLPLPSEPRRQVARFDAIRHGNPASPASLPHSYGPMWVEVRIQSTEAFRGSLAVDICDELGNLLLNLDPWKTSNDLVDIPVGVSVWRFDVDHVYLNAGNYVVALWLATATQSPIDHRLTAMRFTLLGQDGILPDPSKQAHADGLVTCSFALRQVACEMIV